MSNDIPKPSPITRPRRSSIAQAAHVDPAADYDNNQKGTDPAGGGAVTRLQPPLEAPAPATNAKRLGGSKDILFSLPEEEKVRMTNTIAWTTPRTGIRHQSKFIRYAIAKVCAELEREFNNGEQFPPPADYSL